jgi:hypothetical protein
MDSRKEGQENRRAQTLPRARMNKTVVQDRARAPPSSLTLFLERNARCTVRCRHAQWHHVRSVCVQRVSKRKQKMKKGQTWLSVLESSIRNSYPFQKCKTVCISFSLRTNYAMLYIGGVCTMCIDLPMSLHSWSRGEAMFLWDPEITAGSALSCKDPQASCARYVGIHHCTE